MYSIGDLHNPNRISISRNIWFSDDDDRSDYAKVEKNTERLLKISERYFNYAASAGETERDKIETCVMECYRSIGLDEPKRCVWFESPLEALILLGLYVRIFHEKSFNSVIGVESTEIFYRRVPYLEKIFHLNKFKNMLEQRGKSENFGFIAETIDLRTLDPWATNSEHLSNFRATWMRTVILEMLQEEEGQKTFKKVWSDFENILDGDKRQVWTEKGDSLFQLSPEEFKDQFKTFFKAASSWLMIGAARGINDAMVCALYDSLRALGQKIEMDKFFKLSECIAYGGWFWPIDDLCILCDKPVELNLIDFASGVPGVIGTSVIPHSEDGRPAMAYGDGRECHVLYGVRVSKEVAKGDYTVEDIENEQNVEIRRVMIEHMGWREYIEATGCEEIHRDEFGVLFEKKVGFEPIKIVEVANATKEPDGSIRKYMLRVPPHLFTAHDAVAWTFGMTADQYRPDAES